MTMHFTESEIIKIAKYMENDSLTTAVKDSLFEECTSYQIRFGKYKPEIRIFDKNNCCFYGFKIDITASKVLEIISIK